MKILISEEALQNENGHWPTYIAGVADGLRSLGDDVDVLTHQAATASIVRQVGGVPWFSRNCWLDAASQGAVGGIRHNLTFRKELISWLKSHQPYDWVFALTMRLQHLLAFALLSSDKKLPDTTRYLLLFVQGFGLYSGLGKPTSFPRNGSTLLARVCFRLLAPAVRRGQVVLAAETKGMQDELRRFTGLPVALFPHPVEFNAESGKRKMERQQSETKNQEQGTKNKKQALTITCPGFARHEKGNDLLQEAVKQMLNGTFAERYHFVMQWPESFTMPDGSRLGSDHSLSSDPRVEFLNENLNAEAYERLLNRTDLVVLPYRRSSYYHRVSRVAIEAASRGIPLVYTAGTWTEEIAEMTGCGVAIQDETSEAVENALIAAVERFEVLSRDASRSALKVANYHSAERFRDLFMERV